MTALGRAGVPDDIGPMIAVFLSDENRWVNGTPSGKDWRLISEASVLQTRLSWCRYWSYARRVKIQNNRANCLTVRDGLLTAYKVASAFQFGGLDYQSVRTSVFSGKHSALSKSLGERKPA